MFTGARLPPPPLQVAPDERPGCVCPLDVKAFTQQTAAAVALVKMMVDAEGELSPAAEPRIVRVEKKFYYDDSFTEFGVSYDDNSIIFSSSTI